MDDIVLDFEEDAILEIAKQAVERKIGARGLRSIVEKVLSKSMFETPSDPNVEKVIVTKDCISEGKDTIIVCSDKPRRNLKSSNSKSNKTVSDNFAS